MGPDLTSRSLAEQSTPSLEASDELLASPALSIPRSPTVQILAPSGDLQSKRLRLTHRREKSSTSIAIAKPPYPSTRLKGEAYKPWLKHPDPALRWAKALYWGVIVAAIGGTSVLCYFGYASVPQIGKLCLLMEDDFADGINPDFWTHEVRTDGFGNNEFEWTTAYSNNSFTKDGVLYLVPTLTSDALGDGAITDGYTLNLTAAGICTSPNVTQCVAISNASTRSILNPVQGARLSTKGKISTTYGKVEVTARMPLGDWLWPAIWMLPENNTYGEWPASGEIDIAEARGNGPTYAYRGVDYVQSALHWGPITAFDLWYKTFGYRRDKIKGYHSAFHKYTLEWSERYMSIYIDNRAYTTFETRFDDTFWNRGAFPTYFLNTTGQVQALINPWVSSGNNAAPFDQSFYLILNLAVGGTNGYFPENIGNKPWSDGSRTAMADFWAAKDNWYPTWPTDPTERGFAVSSVKIWQKC